MRIKHKILAPISILLAALSLSACDELSSITYNDIKYKTGFYHLFKDKSWPHFFVAGIKYIDKDPLFTHNKYNFWAVNDFAFEFLCADDTRALSWTPIVYVAEDKYKEAKAFYHDDNNFDFYIEQRGDDRRSVLVEDDDVKNAINHAIDVQWDVTKTTETTFKGFVSTNIHCFKQSKDGLFMENVSELVKYNNTLYYLDYHDGSRDENHIKDLGEAGKTLYTAFVNNNLL